MKSPVLENGTPGSVRGQPGNRLSYRDDDLCPLIQAGLVKESLLAGLD